MKHVDIAPVIVAAVSIGANFVLAHMLRKERRLHDYVADNLRALAQQLRDTAGRVQAPPQMRESPTRAAADEIVPLLEEIERDKHARGSN